MDKPGCIRHRRLKDLFKSLVDIYSPSGKEEEILHFLHGYLTRQGLPVISQPVDDNRFNLLVVPPGTEIRLAMIGHLDTVAAYDLDRYGYEEQDDIVRGLGTADMKGGCAAMVEACLALWENGPSLPVAFCLLVGEEEDGDGAEQLVKTYDLPWAVIGEPTELQPCLSSYGYLEMQVRTFGKRMHASLADAGENPIRSMLRLLLRISRYMETRRPDLVYNIRDIFSSQAAFSIPERCEVWLDIHVPPNAPVQEIIRELEDLVNTDRQTSPLTDSELRFATVDMGYRLPESGPLVGALKKVYQARNLPWSPLAFKSHSDANKIHAAGVRTILLGPGSLEQAHAPDEFVSFRQVQLAAELYLDLIRTMFS